MAVLWAAAEPDAFRFAILGDRTGESQPGIYERVWREAAAGEPAFVLSVGDSIEGLNDASADDQWRQFEKSIEPWRRIPLYLTPGNHDIWSDASERLFSKYVGHPPHYSFDYGPAHFTVLDNSRGDQLTPGELAFCEADLKEHSGQPVKFILSHRPSWIVNALMRDTTFPLHRLAKKYGVRYVIAGHVHEMLHYNLEGVDYISMVSSGGHLRASGKYEDGWFFGYALVDIANNDAKISIHELQGRSTSLSAWGTAGLKTVR